MVEGCERRRRKDGAIVQALLLLMFALPAPSTGEGVRMPIRYVTTVSFGEGQCRYWTGDAMFDAAAFRRDLRRRYDHRWGMTVVHGPDLPAQCLTEARNLLARAGFRDVRLEVGRIGPSLP